ncbi:glycoside hydrolase family 65 central catalytic domain protein [Mycobacterium ulcerans str. Harvey]|uniref:Glycoside hydrolase family 65 central catalytic domain protein n=1 Tax=Mycobacterium ulcerans str. Harvey TaxID=1299332 RepID=A0ABN0R4J2_MYCUL|nr:glycoside hydrolase family 65 central catalytic domain protein [Mycobacterium ulcerans str. Harvey]
MRIDGQDALVVAQAAEAADQRGPGPASDAMCRPSRVLRCRSRRSIKAAS